MCFLRSLKKTFKILKKIIFQFPEYLTFPNKKLLHYLLALLLYHVLSLEVFFVSLRKEWEWKILFGGLVISEWAFNRLVCFLSVPHEAEIYETTRNYWCNSLFYKATSEMFLLDGEEEKTLTIYLAPPIGKSNRFVLAKLRRFRVEIVNILDIQCDHKLILT